MSTGHWSTMTDVVTVLRRRWDRGEWLRWVAAGTPWEPVRVPLRAPTARQLGDDVDAARAWAGELQRGADRHGFRLEHRRVGGRLVGGNDVPAAAWFDAPEPVWRLLRVTGDVSAYRAVLGQAADAGPGLADWVTAHPLRALRHAAEWEQVLRTVQWLAAREGSGAYLRQVDVPGVDTKFIEARERLLCELLDAVAPGTSGRRRLVDGERFVGKPDRLRLRTLGAEPLLPGAALTDVTLRVDELASQSLPGEPVVVVENEVTFLALPPLPGSLAVFGAGFDVLRLARVPWLADRRILYWGDIDTHGFVILDRLRGAHPHVESVLMDRGTFLTHTGQWVTEPRPSRERLARLTVAEQEMYGDLVGDVHGSSLRLEQERVNYAAAVSALEDAAR